MALKPILLLAAVAVALPACVHAQRRPLEVQPLTRIVHEPTGPGFRYDPAREALVEYAVDGKIEFLRASGTFLLSWTGSDGSRKEILYEPPNKLSAVIVAEVTFDSQTGLYTYSYTVTNLTSSAQKLKAVYIEGVHIDEAFRPDHTWYSVGFTPFLKTTFATDGWMWARTRGSNGIVPGETVTGFKFTSRRAPGIVTSYIEGWRPALRGVGEDLPEELHAAINRVYFRLPAGLTIGPASSNVPQTVRAQLESLLSLLNEAERQSWLGTSVAARDVRSTLTAIRAFVVDGDMIRARQQASTLLQNVRTHQYEGMLSEGRALVELRMPLQLR